MIDRKEVIELQARIALHRDQTAYTRLYRIYFFPLLQFARSFIGSKETAEEIVSDVFLQVWLMEGRLSGIVNLTVYLYTCTRNLSLNYLRKLKRATTYFLDESNAHLLDSNETPEQLYIASELVRKIDEVINQLPPRCRLIFKMIREDGLKYHETATALDVSVKTVEAQMGIAMKRISAAIQPDTRAVKRLFIAKIFQPFL